MAMIAASPVPTIVAGMVARARRKITAHFLVHHATSAEDAVAFKPQRPIEQRQFDRLRGKGVIREAGAGRYWLDTAAFQADTDARRKRLIPIVLILTLIAAAIPLFFYQG
jgi:hypothetical protein